RSAFSRRRSVRLVRWPPRPALIAECPDAFGEIGASKKRFAELRGGLSGLLPALPARFGDEAEPGAHGFGTGVGDFSGDLASPGLQVRAYDHVMSEARSRSLPRVDDPAGYAELHGAALAHGVHNRAKNDERPQADADLGQSESCVFGGD